MSDVLRREDADEAPLLVRTGVDRIKLAHDVDPDTGDVTIYDPDDRGVGKSTRWITSDLAFEGGIR